MRAHAQWVLRGGHGSGRVDLKNCTYQRVAPVGANLQGARLRRCTFEDSVLSSANLADATAEACVFQRCELEMTTLREATQLCPSRWCNWGSLAPGPCGRSPRCAPRAETGQVRIF